MRKFHDHLLNCEFGFGSFNITRYLIICNTRFFPVRYGVTLFAVCAAKKSRRILLNPGPTHIMDYDDRCYYIAISSEEDSYIKAYKEPKQSSVGLFKNSVRYRNDSVLTASSVALELRTDAVEPGEFLFLVHKLLLFR